MNLTLGELWNRRFDLPPRSLEERTPLPRSLPATKTAYLPRPVLIGKSDVQSYVAQLDPPFSSLANDVPLSITGKIVGGESTTDAEKQLLVDVTDFGTRWKAEKAKIDSMWTIPGGDDPRWPKEWSVLESFEKEYRDLRNRADALGHSPSVAAPPSKTDISPPTPIGVSTALKIAVPTVLLVGAGGVVLYLATRH